MCPLESRLKRIWEKMICTDAHLLEKNFNDNLLSVSGNLKRYKIIDIFVIIKYTFKSVVKVFRYVSSTLMTVNSL